jgi:hypothetical protein
MKIRPAGLRIFISPTLKRTEGRAPMWGSELTSKAAAQQGDPEEAVAGLNAQVWTSVRGGDSRATAF